MKTAAMPIFGDAYLGDTRHLNLEEHGAYFLLLLIAWRSPNCAIPDDDKRIAQMLGIPARRWAAIKPTVMAFWTLGEHGWTQKRQLKERDFVERKVQQNSRAAKARWNGQPVEKKREAASERISARTSDRISERNAPHTSPSDTNVSAGNEPAKTMFDMGVALLVGSGSTPAAARSLIGRWRKDHGEPAVIEALREATARSISEPRAWITAKLSRQADAQSEHFRAIELKYGSPAGAAR